MPKMPRRAEGPPRTLKLPAGTAELPAACAGRDSLRRARLPRGLRRIGMDAFKDCTALRRVDFPEGLELIELDAFFGCTSLTRAELPDSLLELGDEAFGNCVSLRRLRLPQGLKRLGLYAFQNCRSLEELCLPDGLEELGTGTFSGCTRLRRVRLPAGLKYLSPYAFNHCPGLEEVEHPEPGRFAEALAGTPFAKKRFPDREFHEKLPMELLYRVSGGISGVFLTARGCTGFDIDRDYGFFTTETPFVYECRTLPSGPSRLVDGRLRPLDSPGAPRGLTRFFYKCRM